MASGKLTALKVKNLVAPGRYGDGGGLWLQVRDAQRRSWLFRFMLAGKARQMGLGPLDDVGLADARIAAAECRKLLLSGIDPISKRDDAKAALRATSRAMTFRQVADRYLAAHEGSWRHAKHRTQWRTSLEQYAHPLLGDLPVDTIATGEVMQVLEPIWHEKPETASRVRGRIEAILDYAKAREWRGGDNPARWKGHVSNMLPRRNRSRSVEHHPALPWKEIGGFMAAVEAEPGTAALALRFLIMTAARTGEAIGATWAEIDLADSVWTVPGSRMKGGREHRVPLSAAALNVLTIAAALRLDKAPGAFLFPSTRAGKPLSDMAMAMLLRRMKRADLTVHGFRSTFRDWVSEATGYSREIAEAALAHVVGSQVEQAYRRGDALEKRRKLMEEWARFCGQVLPAGGDVVAIRLASS